MKLIRLFTAGVAASMFIACGTADTESPKPNDTPPPGNMMTPPPPPPEPIAVTKQSLKEIFQKNLTTALKGLATTEDITREMEMFEGLGISITRDDSCDEERSSVPDNGMNEPPNPDPQPEPCEEDTRTAQERASEMATEATDALFDEENLETEEDKKVVYKMVFDCGEEEPEPGDRTDPPGAGDPNNPDPGNDPEPAPEPDDCEPTTMRMEMSSTRQGDIDIDMLMGDAKEKMLRINLYEKYVGVDVDLKDAYSFLETELDVETSTDGPNLPESVEGRITAGVDFSKADTIEASFSIKEAIKVRSEPGEYSYKLDVGVAEPAGSLTVDEVAKSVVGLLNMKTLDLEIMSDIFGSEDLKSGKLNLRLGGFGGSMTLTENGDNDTFAVNDINMGDTTTFVKLDDNTLVSIDLNETTGRKFSLNIDREMESTKVGFTPQFDVKVMLALAPLFDENAEEPAPDWLLDETFKVTIDGAALPQIQVFDSLFESDDDFDDTAHDDPNNSDDDSSNPGQDPGDPMVPEPEPEPEEPTQLLKVVDGLLTLKAIKADKTVSVSAGQCLLVGGEEDSMDDPNMGEEESEHIFDIFRAGTCAE
ncbi:MAG: hypothetical protein VYC39_06130 [Myxococcota bacterium]|nr:hypothetical protein [Myxococcota bacterium]